MEQKIELGPCRILVNDNEIGLTAGPTRVTVRTLWRERRSDRYGAAVIDRVAVGADVRVTTRLAEKTFENLQRALPDASTGTDYLGIGRTPGFKASSTSFTLRIHPEERTDAGRDILLHRAVCSGVVKISYGPGGRRGFEVEFIGLLDSTRADGDMLGRIYQAE